MNIAFSEQFKLIMNFLFIILSLFSFNTVDGTVRPNDPHLRQVKELLDRFMGLLSPGVEIGNASFDLPAYINLIHQIAPG